MRPRFYGVRLVGGYHVPYQDAGAYQRRIKRARKAALKAMAQLHPYALSQWADTGQDGEAITGLDAKGELMALIHLDLDGLELIERGMREGNLAELLRQYNDHSEQD